MIFDENDKDVYDASRYPRNLESLCIHDGDNRLYAGLLFSDYDDVLTKIKTPVSLKRAYSESQYNNVALLAEKSIPIGVVCYLEKSERKHTSETYQDAESIADFLGVSLRRVNRGLIL